MSSSFSGFSPWRTIMILSAIFVLQPSSITSDHEGALFFHFIGNWQVLVCGAAPLTAARIKKVRITKRNLINTPRHRYSRYRAWSEEVRRAEPCNDWARWQV